jgi:hypothetical protein
MLVIVFYELMPAATLGLALVDLVGGHSDLPARVDGVNLYHSTATSDL